MKRLLLLCREQAAPSLRSCTIAVPAGVPLSTLHALLRDAFGSDTCAFAFSLPNGASCSCTATGSEKENGLSSLDSLGAVLARDGDSLVCRFGTGRKAPAVSVERTGKDTGKDSECLEVSGGFGGTPEDITSRMHGEWTEEEVDAILDEWIDRKTGESLPEPPPRALDWRAPDDTQPSAGTFALDDSPVPPELFRRACELAARVWKLAPWKEMEESDIAAIRLADGRERILSVMGIDGKHHALAFYPDYATYRAIRAAATHPDEEGIAMFFSLWQWQLMFSATPQLLPGEAAAVKASGVRFARGHLPSFEAFAPGFTAWRAGGREMADLVEFLEAAIALFGDADALERTYSDGNDDAAEIPVWSRAADGAWRLAFEPREPCLRFPLDLPDDLLEKLRALPVRERTMSFSELAWPVVRSSARQSVARMVLAADEGSGFLLPPSLPKETEAHLYRPCEAMAELARAILASPFKDFPKRLASKSPLLAVLLARLAELRGDGAKYDADASCRHILAFRRELSRKIGL